MSSTIITLTTDFGTGSPYVAQMKGVILSLASDVTLVDISHEVPPQDIRQGALVLAEATRTFPAGSVHVAVVDPGVGTPRKIVLAEIAGRRYIAPDNGLLSRVAAGRAPSWIYALSNPAYHRHPVSATFHGRDIMAPVAAQVGLGVPPAELGEPLDQLQELDWPVPEVVASGIVGCVLSIDSFGNVITNIDRRVLDSAGLCGVGRVTCGGRSIADFVRTYAERPPGTAVALIGSSGLLEIAVVGGNAARWLPARVGAEIVVEP